MKKNNKGFTLIELLAVIVILGIILVIASTNVIKSINDSKAKSKYIAAKEIVQIAEAYFATHGGDSVSIKELDEYLEDDTTNPKDGSNNWASNEKETQKICKGSYEAQTDYNNHEEQYYNFDGYQYSLNGTCN